MKILFKFVTKKMANWKVVITFLQPHDAHLARTYLDSNGIDAMVKDDITSQILNPITNLSGGVKLLVPENQEQKAIDLFEEGGFLEAK